MQISFDEVDFRYGNTSVLTQLTWALDTGARVVLLGPNGAGKTTLMRLAAGLLKPHRGRVLLDGTSATPADLAAHVALMPQHVTAVPRLRCVEQVSYAGWLAGLSRDEASRRAADALAVVGLTDKVRARATELSGGQLRRLGLAETLVRQTAVVAMDEPTAGLDPAQRAKFRGILDSLPATTSLIVSTHETHDLIDSFDLVAILSAGEFLFIGTPAELLQHTSARDVEAAYTALLEAS